MPVAELKKSVTKKKILIIEDDRSLREALRYNFLSEGFDVRACDDGVIGLRSATEWGPDIVILDLMLPGVSGIEICRSIRREGLIVPVIILTAKDSEVDRVVGLEIGADDYVTKPFSMRELIARIWAHLRRMKMIQTIESEPDNSTFVIGDLVIDNIGRRVTNFNREIPLKPREFDLLTHMAGNRGRVFTREQLLDRVWGYHYEGDTRTVDVHIRWLRKKIEEDPSTPKLLQTVRGIGYRFSPNL